jgi:hypothetical protein
MPLSSLRGPVTIAVALAAFLAHPAATLAADTTPPSILMFSPVPDETFGTSSTVTIAYSLQDDSPTTVGCTIDGAPLLDCPSGRTVTGLGAGAHTLVVTATDSSANSASQTTHISVDGTPPETTQEAPVVNQRGEVTFKFGSSEPANFNCKIDDEAWTMCGSPMVRQNVANGHHIMSAVAVDRWGNVDATPAVREFDVAVDRTAPVALITSGPTEHSFFPVGTSVTFDFTADDAVGFICGLHVQNEDMNVGGLTIVSSERGCSSPKTYTGLPAGVYQFTVNAYDAANNTSGTASRSFVIGNAVFAPLPPSPTVVSRALGTFAKRAGQVLAKGGIEGLLGGTPTQVAFSAPGAGVVRLDLQAPAASSAAKRKKAKPVVVATATTTVARAGTAKLRVKLTAAGRKLLRRAKRVSLNVVTSFTPTGARKAQTTSRNVTVKRKRR